MAKVIYSNDRVVLSGEEYAELLSFKDRNRCLVSALETAKKGLESVIELLTEHPVLRGHAEKVRDISICLLIVNNTIEGVR